MLAPVGRWATSLAVTVVGALALWAAPGSGVARAAGTNDRPAGFWYGSDSSYMRIGGSGPYREPVIGGSYGGYMGMVGNWAWWLKCPGKFLAWSKTDSERADSNRRRYAKGVGAGAYWFMGGPGVDPHYNGTAREARRWGVRQAARALSDIRAHPYGQRILYPVLFMDIELPGIAPAPDNGWTSVYTSPCSGAVRRSHIAPRVNRAEFNGFWGYVRTHSPYRPGVYSSPTIWSTIFGTGSTSVIRHTYEWTYWPESSNLGQAPSGWCLRGTSRCAEFFGGVTTTSPHAVMWQFSGGGGVRNGYGDFDQIDGNRTP